MLLADAVKKHPESGGEAFFGRKAEREDVEASLLDNVEAGVQMTQFFGRKRDFVNARHDKRPDPFPP